MDVKKKKVMDVHNTSLTGVNMQEIMSVFLFQTDRYSENNK